jgi:glycosyltransferase involved in cell wall biosynthesis
MNVIIVSPGGIKMGGGMGTVAKNIYEALSSQPGYTVSVLDSRGERGILFSFIYLFIAIFKLLMIFSKNKNNLLHINVSERFSFFRKFIFITLGKLFGCKVVLHHHGAEFIQCYQNASLLYKILVNKSIAMCDVNIVLGEKWKNFIQKNICESARVLVLYNAVPNVFLKRSKNKIYTISMIANLTERKGVLVLLNALRSIKDKFSFRVQFIGGGEVNRFKTVANDMGLKEVCSFLGWQDRDSTKKLLAESHVLVLPSYDEGLPMVILEAMSQGIPVICTPVGSIGEVLSHSESALFVNTGDPESLAITFVQLHDDKNLEEHLIQNSRKLFEEKFSMDGYLDSLKRIYLNI